MIDFSSLIFDVISLGNLIAGLEQEGVCGNLAMCRSLELTCMCPFLEAGAAVL